jgi:hypothetical protein
MVKNPVACPFSNGPCTECAVYRGRHQHLILSKPHRTPSDGQQQKKHSQSGTSSLSAEFQALRNSAEPWTGKQGQRKDELKIRLKVIDVERKETRICDLHELQKWHWGNPRLYRLIDGRQVTDLDNLIEILYHKAEAGCEEVDLYEAPRFMMLAGG